MASRILQLLLRARVTLLRLAFVGGLASFAPLLLFNQRTGFFQLWIQSGWIWLCMSLTMAGMLRAAWAVGRNEPISTADCLRFGLSRFLPALALGLPLLLHGTASTMGSGFGLTTLGFFLAGPPLLQPRRGWSIWFSLRTSFSRLPELLATAFCLLGLSIGLSYLFLLAIGEGDVFTDSSEPLARAVGTAVLLLAFLTGMVLNLALWMTAAVAWHEAQGFFSSSQGGTGLDCPGLSPPR